jgi:hypothetical protein
METILAYHFPGHPVEPRTSCAEQRVARTFGFVNINLDGMPLIRFLIPMAPLTARRQYPTRRNPGRFRHVGRQQRTVCNLLCLDWPCTRMVYRVRQMKSYALRGIR